MLELAAKQIHAEISEVQCPPAEDVLQVHQLDSLRRNSISDIEGLLTLAGLPQSTDQEHHHPMLAQPGLYSWFLTLKDRQAFRGTEIIVPRYLVRILTIIPPPPAGTLSKAECSKQGNRGKFSLGAASGRNTY